MYLSDPESGPAYRLRRKCASSFPRLTPRFLILSFLALFICSLIAFRHSDDLPNLPTKESFNKWSIGFTQQQKSLLEEELSLQREALAKCTEDHSALRKQQSAAHQHQIEDIIDANDVRTWPSPTPELPLDATLEQRIAAWNSTPVADAVRWARFVLMPTHSCI